MPRTMTDLGAAKALQTALFLVYMIPIYCSLADAESADRSWKFSHCALPVVAYVCGKILKIVATIASGVDVIFSDVDIPYQKSFYHTILLATGALHVVFAFSYGPKLLDARVLLFAWPVVRSLSSLAAVTTTWCFYTAWDLQRVNAIDTSVVHIWAWILLSTVICGPAGTLTGTWMWRATQLAKAKSFQHEDYLRML